MDRNDLRAVELVRAIRDSQYEQSKDKSVEEVLAYFREEAEAVNAEARQALDRTKTSAGN